MNDPCVHPLYAQQNERMRVPLLYPNPKSDHTTNPANPSIPTMAEVEQRAAHLLGHAAPTRLSAPPTPSQTEQRPAAPQHPILNEAALHGVAGRVIRILAPHTEAHPAALLLQLLAAFGNLIGPGPHCMVESARHPLNLFVILVGDSSKARKGTSWNWIANFFAGVDPAWLATRVSTGRLTAAGLVQTLQDQQPPTDRRLLVLAEEFATVLHTLKRGNGHLSPLLRSAWDHGNLPTLHMQQDLRATGTHISLIAHITEQELAHLFERSLADNGFANRCLWTWVERSNCLPDGGSPSTYDLACASAALQRAVNWATAQREILFHRNQPAGELWADVYPELSYHQPGLRGAATSRGEAQVLRLSALYAALDCSETVTVAHLQAALAVWDYCSQSAEHLFGVSARDAVADRIREAVETSRGGLNKTQIRRLFNGHVDTRRIDAALEQLAVIGSIARKAQPTPGRVSTVWSALAEHLPEDCLSMLVDDLPGEDE